MRNAEDATGPFATCISGLIAKIRSIQY